MNKRFMHFLEREGVGDLETLTETPQLRGEGANRRLLLSVARPDQLERLFAKLFDESEFLSPHGLRALSAYHREHPYQFDVEGFDASIDYEPAESTTSMFGGNSNWRGPIWFPVNYLVIESLERYYRFYGDDLQLEYPTGSGRRLTLDRITADLQDRLISLFTKDENGRRACFGGDRADADRPRLEGQPDLRRVLPRRQRCRARRLPPDRMDRSDRRPDPAPPRSGPIPRLTSYETSAEGRQSVAARLSSTRTDAIGPVAERRRVRDRASAIRHVRRRRRTAGPRDARSCPDSSGQSSGIWPSAGASVRLTTTTCRGAPSAPLHDQPSSPRYDVLSGQPEGCSNCHVPVPNPVGADGVREVVGTTGPVRRRRVRRVSGQEDRRPDAVAVELALVPQGRAGQRRDGHRGGPLGAPPPCASTPAVRHGSRGIAPAGTGRRRQRAGDRARRQCRVR